MSVLDNFFTYLVKLCENNIQTKSIDVCYDHINPHLKDLLIMSSSNSSQEDIISFLHKISENIIEYYLYSCYCYIVCLDVINEVKNNPPEKLQIRDSSQRFYYRKLDTIEDYIYETILSIIETNTRSLYFHTINIPNHIKCNYPEHLKLFFELWEKRKR